MLVGSFISERQILKANNHSVQNVTSSVQFVETVNRFQHVSISFSDASYDIAIPSFERSSVCMTCKNASVSQ